MLVSMTPDEELDGSLIDPTIPKELQEFLQALTLDVLSEMIVDVVPNSGQFPMGTLTETAIMLDVEIRELLGDLDLETPGGVRGDGSRCLMLDVETVEVLEDVDPMRMLLGPFLVDPFPILLAELFKALLHRSIVGYRVDHGTHSSYLGSVNLGK